VEFLCRFRKAFFDSEVVGLDYRPEIEALDFQAQVQALREFIVHEIEERLVAENFLGDKIGSTADKQYFQKLDEVLAFFCQFPVFFLFLLRDSLYERRHQFPDGFHRIFGEIGMKLLEIILLQLFVKSFSLLFSLLS